MEKKKTRRGPGFPTRPLDAQMEDTIGRSLVIDISKLLTNSACRLVIML